MLFIVYFFSVLPFFLKQPCLSGLMLFLEPFLLTFCRMVLRLSHWPSFLLMSSSSLSISFFLCLQTFRKPLHLNTNKIIILLLSPSGMCSSVCSSQSSFLVSVVSVCWCLTRIDSPQYHFSDSSFYLPLVLPCFSSSPLSLCLYSNLSTGSNLIPTTHSSTLWNFPVSLLLLF